MHCLIVGKTMSGKTTFAKKKSKAGQRSGIASIILDPFLDPQWVEKPELVFITNNRDEFLHAVWNSRSCYVFVDEAGSEIGKYSDVMNELATRGRHWGHKCFFITQRVKQISNTIRSQCSDLVIFKQALADTKDLASEYVDNQINEAHTLELGEFIYVRHGQKTVKLNVFKL